jgi:hypothetical protein
MKRKTANSRTGFTRRRFLVEGLEPRCLLAGNVNVFVSGGTLFVQGDNNDNAVLIQQEGNGVYSVTGLDFANLNTDGLEVNAGPTSINGDDSGDSAVFSGVTNDINVDLRGGNDGLGIGNDLNTLSNLAENCFGINFNPDDGGGTLQVAQEGTLFVPRNLIVNLGDGDDFTAISANVGSLDSKGNTKKGGVANINLGNGNNAAAFGDGNVADDLLISGGNGSDDACVSDVNVRDLLAVQLGNGDENDADIENFNAGHALVTTGVGNDKVRLENFNLKRELVVSTGNGNDQVDVEDFTAQNVTVDTGAGNDGEGGVRGDISPAVSVNGPVTVAFADISKTLVLVTGSGNDFATINNVDAHDIVFDTGSGDDGDQFDPISMYNVLVQGNVTFVTGSGNDFAYMHSGESESGNIKGNLTVDMGADNDNLEIVGQSIGKDLNVFLGSGNNNVGIGAGFGEAVGDGSPVSVGRNLNIFGGPKTDNVGLFNLTVLNDLFADLGAGNDNLLIEGNEELEAPVQIGRNATLLGGAGSDNMTINFANIGGNALLDAGSGGDTVSIDFCNVGKTATLLMGSGDDTLNLSNSLAAKLIARGGSGKDTFNNDIGVTKNGRSSDGKIDVQEFEFFNVE